MVKENNIYLSDETGFYGLWKVPYKRIALNLTRGRCKVARSKSISEFQAEGNVESHQRRADLIKEFKRFPSARKTNSKPASRKAIFSAARGL